MSDEPVEESKPSPEDSIEFFKAFLRVGQFTWEEWKGMDSESRAYVVEASEHIQAERAALLGIASTGVDGAARVYSRVDHGDSMISQALARAVARSARK